MTYADSYERALTNGIISIQKGNIPGVMIYMLPLGHGVSKGRSYHGWGTPENSFWCCYGTGLDSYFRPKCFGFTAEVFSVSFFAFVNFVKGSSHFQS